MLRFTKSYVSQTTSEETRVEQTKDNNMRKTKLRARGGDKKQEKCWNELIYWRAEVRGGGGLMLETNKHNLNKIQMDVQMNESH